MKTTQEWLSEAQDLASTYRQRLETGDVRLLGLEPARPVQMDEVDGVAAGAEDSEDVDTNAGGLTSGG